MDFQRNFHKATGIPTHPDSIFFHWSGPSLMPTRLSAPVSGVDWSLASPFTNCPLRAPFPHSLLASPFHFRSREISCPKPFVWFRTKTDKGIVCLAGHLHSVTVSGLNGLTLRFSHIYSCTRFELVFCIL